MSTIGERIRMIRNNLSRQTFADRYDIHRNTLERWEKNQRQPDVTFLAALVAGENITQEWLLSGVGPLHPETPSESSDVAKPPTRRRLQNCNSLGNNDLEKNETPTVGGFSTEEFSALQRELREQDKELRDLLRQTGDLRVENAELRARVRDLERELREALKPEERSAPVASAG